MADGPDQEGDNAFDLTIFLWHRRRFILGMALLGLLCHNKATLALAYWSK